MRGFFLGLCTCLVGQVALGETSDEALRRYLAGSDLVVLGHFAKCPIEATSDGSVVQYRTHFSVEKILKADPANETSPDSTLSVIITRFEQGPDDRLPELQEGGRCVLFLCRSSRSESPTYVSADPWFAVQRPLPTLTSELWRLGHDTNVPYEEPTQLTESPVNPAYPVRYDIAIEGEWRLFLPAGFEHCVKITRVDANYYRIDPKMLNMSGLYEFQGDRLVKVESMGEKGPANFEWTIRSPHMLRMTSQPSGTGSDYSGAILFRTRKEEASVPSGKSGDVRSLPQ